MASEQGTLRRTGCWGNWSIKEHLISLRKAKEYGFGARDAPKNVVKMIFEMSKAVGVIGL